MQDGRIRDDIVRARREGEAGFALLSLLVAIMIIGIIASVAVPRFGSIMATANTAKIQADLTTLDTAIVMYQTENGTLPSTISDLKEYVNDIGSLKPPQGKCNLKNNQTVETVEIKATEYKLEDVTDDNTKISTKRATCDSHVAGDFGK